ncbi:MAG: hypothetical protein HUJ26_15280 [Planctomycetaceae bacterium]|nr:hypothetical protein [Planctomycetaceae bacterium]
MSSTWPEYFDWLHEKPLKWPQPPPLESVPAQSSLQPIPGIEVVLWDFYGTLVRISDGELKLFVDDDLRMQIALEKTLEEFAMWQSMTRKPGAPWRYLMSQYRELLDRLQMTQSCAKGDLPQIGLHQIWSKILERLLKKDYGWDRSIHGDRDRLAQHIGFFYHLSLQGVEIIPEVLKTLDALHRTGVRQAIFGETERFSIPHFCWTAQRQTGKPFSPEVLDSSLCVLSHSLGLRKSSQTFYKTAEKQFSKRGIRPDQVFVVSTRLKGDLEFAKQRGWKTALLAFDRLSLRATSADLKRERLKPDRLVTSHSQILELLTPSH